MKEKWSTKIKLNASGVAVMTTNPGKYKIMYLNPKTNRLNQLYVGRAENLRNTLALHLPWRENDPRLASYLRKYNCFFQVIEESMSSDKSYKSKDSNFARFIKMLVGAPVSTVNYR